MVGGAERKWSMFFSNSLSNRMRLEKNTEDLDDETRLKLE